MPLEMDRRRASLCYSDLHAIRTYVVCCIMSEEKVFKAYSHQYHSITNYKLEASLQNLASLDTTTVRM